MGKYRKHIAKTITKYRKALNIKQAELAKQLNVAPSSISAWENNLNSPDVEIIAELCDIFNISMDEMYGVNTKNSTSSDELEIVEKYKALDYHGRKIVDTILNIEYDRCTDNHQNEYDDILQTEEIERVIAEHKAEYKKKEKESKKENSKIG